MSEKPNHIDNLPLVSVCVITFNHKNYIVQCLERILMQQTDFSFEILLGEDESNDGTREICMEYHNKYPDKVRLFLRSRKDVIYINGNPTGRFNLMENLKSAKGKYIAICEGDDYWADPNKLQKQVDFLQANDDYSICFHRVYELEDGKELALSNLISSATEETYTIEDLASHNFIHTTSAVFRSNIIRSLPSWFDKSPVADYPLHILSARNGKIKYFPQPMAVYRKHAASAWSSRPKIYMYENLLIMLGYLKQEVSENVKIILGYQEYFLLVHLAEEYKAAKDEEKYIESLAQALIINKTYTSQWITNYLLPLQVELKKSEGPWTKLKVEARRLKRRLKK